MTTINQKAFGNVCEFEFQDCRVQRKSARFLKRVSKRRARKALKVQIAEAIEDYEDAVWAENHARRLAELIRRKAGFGAGAVTIEHGKVVVL